MLIAFNNNQMFHLLRDQGKNLPCNTKKNLKKDETIKKNL